MNQSQAQLPLQDITVIGAGPAGVTAAIYAARRGLAVTLVAEKIGGQLKEAARLENLILLQTVSGTELAVELQSRIAEQQLTLKQYVQVQRIECKGSKTLHLSSGESISSRTVIVATGARWREMGVPGEKENIGSGVAYCPHCDGPSFKDRVIAVVGSGNAAVAAALQLSLTVRSVTLLSDAEKLHADSHLIAQIQGRDNIRLLLNSAVSEVLSVGGKVVALKYLSHTHKSETTLDLEGVFVQIGSRPNHQFLQGKLKQNASGEVLIDANCQTSEAGIFACGDVSSAPYKQVLIAMGEGAKAALAAADYLQQHSG